MRGIIRWVLRKCWGKQEGEDPRHLLGRRGELAAERYLVGELGYRFVARNWKRRRGELDLIVQDGQITVFVEVRTRSFGSSVSGFDSITYQKRKVLRRTVREWCRERRPRPYGVRFDVIAIEAMPDGELRLAHNRNVGWLGRYWLP